jgi:hypothetical protein
MGGIERPNIVLLTLRVRIPGFAVHFSTKSTIDNSMKDSWLLPIHLFDRDADVQIVERRLPHWSQSGTVCFITWRTHESMPRRVIEKWLEDRAQWLRSHGIDPNDVQWRQHLHLLGADRVRQFLSTFWNRWHDSLDECHGACVLRRANLAKLVADSLRFFDGERYLLFDYVVMPITCICWPRSRPKRPCWTSASRGCITWQPESTSNSVKQADSGSKTSLTTLCEAKSSSNSCGGISRAIRKRLGCSPESTCTIPDRRLNRPPQDASRGA